MSASARCGPAGTFFTVIITLLVPLSAVSGDDPRAWLERMGRAVEELNYSGTLVHMDGAETSVLRLVHRVDGGRVREKITSEDAGREIIRDDNEVTCIFPDQRVVLVEPRNDLDRAQSPLRGRLPGHASIREAFYTLAFAGTERVAGRDARVVMIRPKDSYRYGYRLWLDRATAMPLKTQLVDEQGRLLEQMLFSDISLAENIPDSAVRPSMAIDSFVMRRVAPLPEASAAESEWSVHEAPAGFALALNHSRIAPDAERGLRHLVFSDGLATVSLFIEPAVAAAEQVEGLSQIGGANAYTTVRDGHMVTAVGGVPARTVEILALSARPVKAGLDAGSAASSDAPR